MSRRFVTRKPSSLDSKDAIRAFLAISAVIIAVLSLVLYAITREPALLLATSLSGIGLNSSYHHYLGSKDSHNPP